MTYDCCLAWNWEEDIHFVALLKESCQSQNLSFLSVTAGNLEETINALQAGETTFRVFHDRASDTDERFAPLSQLARDRAVYVINPPEACAWATDKAKMHLNLTNAGLQTPYTIFLPSFKEQPDLQPIELSPLGERFIIKPAHGGGGEGVITEATSWEKVLEARKAYPEDVYLLQVRIVPSERQGRPTWFRVLNCAGEVYPCWWNTQSHIYTPLTLEEEKNLSLGSLREIGSTIQRSCGLEFFSSEIALTPDNIFVVVDYVNDQIDLRPQSKFPDGIPDTILSDVANRLARLVAAHCPSAPIS